jgi:hypothetical protein
MTFLLSRVSNSTLRDLEVMATHDLHYARLQGRTPLIEERQKNKHAVNEELRLRGMTPRSPSKLHEHLPMSLDAATFDPEAAK